MSIHLLIVFLLLQTTSLSSGNAASVSSCDPESPESKISDFRQRTDLVTVPIGRQNPFDTTKPENRSIDIQIHGRPIKVKYVRFPAVSSRPRGTVLYFCGGPVACTKIPIAGLPADFDVVTMDPLGLGDNYDPSMTPEMKSVESQGIAGAELVKQLGLKAYVINGRSIGSSSASCWNRWMSRGRGRKSRSGTGDSPACQSPRTNSNGPNFVQSRMLTINQDYRNLPRT